MKSKSRLPLILFLCAFHFSLFAENWHPFPFKIAYYGHKVSIGLFGVSPGWVPDALAKGHLIEGLYLDSSYRVDNTFYKKRSTRYPTSEYSWEGGFEPVINNSKVSTSVDSQTVVANCESYFYLGRTYFPGKINLGMEAAQYGGMVVSKSYGLVFDVMDSIALVRTGADSVLWSKKFGLLKIITRTMNGDIQWLELMGVKDLGIGWQDPVYIAAKPSVGDEVHFLSGAKGGIDCQGSPNPPVYYNGYTTARKKIISADSNGANVSTIYADPGLTQGFRYDNYEYYGNLDIDFGDSILPAGVFVTDPSTFTKVSNFMGWQDSSGYSLKLLTKGNIDTSPNTLFLSCVKMPHGEFSIRRNFMDHSCRGELLKFQYPTYLKTQSGCEFGKPFEPVTVVTTPNLISNEVKVRTIPQPAQNQFRFEGVSSGQFILFDALGKASIKGEVSENQIDISSLSAGLYFYSFVSEMGKFHTGKVWKK